MTQIEVKSFRERALWLLEQECLPYGGLCSCFDGYHLDIFGLFEPTTEDIKLLHQEGLSSMYWASLMPIMGSLGSDPLKREYALTPMRQTILCFLLCIDYEETIDEVTAYDGEK